MQKIQSPSQVERTPSIICEEIWEQISICWATVIKSCLNQSIEMIPLIFVGHVSMGDLAAVAVASAIANITGYSIHHGIGDSLYKLSSSAFEENDMENVFLAIQGGIAIVCLTCLPITLIWAFSYYLLNILGQTSQIAVDTRDYLIFLVPGLWLNAFSICMINWLCAQKRETPVTTILTVTALLNPYINYLYINYCRFGFLGAAMATSSVRLIELLLLLAYIFNSTILTNARFAWSYSFFQNLNVLLSRGFFRFSMWSNAIFILFSGMLPNPEVNICAMITIQNSKIICMIIPSGFKVSGESSVGTEIGANSPKTAKLSASVSVALATMTSTFLAIVVLFWKHYWGYIFTRDDGVVVLVNKLLILLAVYVIVDSVQSALGGVMKGLGKGNMLSAASFATEYIIGMPSSAYLAFSWGLDLGIIGLMIGRLFGLWILLLANLVAVLWTDFETTARAAIECPQQKNPSGEGNSMYIIVGNDEYEYSDPSASDSINDDDNNNSVNRAQENRTSNRASDPWQNRFTRAMESLSRLRSVRQNSIPTEGSNISRRHGFSVDDGFIPTLYNMIGLKTVKQSNYELVQACTEVFEDSNIEVQSSDEEDK